MTPAQLEPSAKAPCTRTTVGASVVWVASDIYVLLCISMASDTEAHVARGARAESSTERPERCAHLFREELRLLPGGEVAASLDLVEVDEVVRIRALGPA